MPDHDVDVYSICEYSCEFNVQYSVDDGVGSFTSAVISFTVEGGGTTIISDSFSVTDRYGNRAFSATWHVSLGDFVSCTVSGSINVIGAQNSYTSQFAPTQVTLQDGSSNGMVIWAS